MINIIPKEKVTILHTLSNQYSSVKATYTHIKPINNVMPAITLMLLLERILFFKNSANGLIQTKIPKKTKKKK